MTDECRDEFDEIRTIGWLATGEVNPREVRTFLSNAFDLIESKLIVWFGLPDAAVSTTRVTLFGHDEIHFIRVFERAPTRFPNFMEES